MYSIEEITKHTKEAALFFDEIKAVYLFGSYADGTAHRASDVDIALLLNKGLTQFEYDNIKNDFYGKLSIQLKSDAIDVIVLNTTKSSELKYAAVQDGILLFERGDDIFQFELNVRNEYFDHMAALRRAGLTRG